MYAITKSGLPAKGRVSVFVLVLFFLSFLLECLFTITRRFCQRLKHAHINQLLSLSHTHSHSILYVPVSVFFQSVSLPPARSEFQDAFSSSLAHTHSNICIVPGSRILSQTVDHGGRALSLSLSLSLSLTHTHTHTLSHVFMPQNAAADVARTQLDHGRSWSL